MGSQYEEELLYLERIAVQLDALLRQQEIDILYLRNQVREEYIDDPGETAPCLGTIFVTAIDLDGDPAAGLTVRAVHATSGLVSTATTDAAGHATIGPVRGGVYTVSATISGVLVSVYPVVVRCDAETDVTLQPPATPPPGKVEVCFYPIGCSNSTTGLHIVVKRHDTGEVIAELDDSNIDHKLCLYLDPSTQYDVTGSGADYVTTTATITTTGGLSQTYPITLPLADPDNKICGCGCPDPWPKTLHLTDKYGAVDLVGGSGGLCVFSGGLWAGCHSGFDAAGVTVRQVLGLSGACTNKCDDPPAGATILIAYCLSCATGGKWTLIKGVTWTGCPDPFTGFVTYYLANFIKSLSGPPECDWRAWTCADGIPSNLLISSKEIDFTGCGTPIDLSFDMPNTNAPFGSPQILPTSDTVTVTE